LKGNALMIFSIIVLLALDWAALHDILKGEADVWAEYTTVLLSLVIFGALLLRRLQRRHA